MKNWDDLKFILAVDRAKTLSGAARMLSLNATTVARRLDRLSEDIGEPLFLRRGQQLVASDAAQPLVQIARSLELSLGDFYPTKGGPDTRNYKARISVEMCLLEVFVGPHLPKILIDHENLTIETSVDAASLALGETDLHLGYDEPDAGRLVRRKVGDCVCGVFANEKFAVDLEGWVKVDFRGTHQNCNEEVEQKFGYGPRASVTSVHLATHMIREMPLAAVLPVNHGARCEGLVELSEFGVRNTSPIWLTFHESRRRDPVIRMVSDFILECFASVNDVSSITQTRKFGDVVAPLPLQVAE